MSTAPGTSPPPPVLVGAGLRLRAFRPDDPTDVALLQRFAADPVGRQWSRSLRRIATAATAAGAWLAERAATPGTYEWVVEDETTGAALGRVGLHRDDPDADPEVGYWTLPESRGTGVARRAARLAARFAHEDLGEARVGLLHAVANPASCKAALAASFAYEGTLRGGLDHGDGIRYDAHVHARLADDPWDPLPAPYEPGPAPDLVVEDLLLRAWTSADAPVAQAAAADVQITLWNPLSVSDEASALRWAQERADSRAVVPWLITDRVDGTALGCLTLHEFSPEHARCEAGYWVLPHARGRGVATRSLEAAARWAYERWGLARVELYHATDNPASCTVAQRAGFAVEGTLRSSYRYGDGQLHDEHLHGRLATDPVRPTRRRAGTAAP